MNEVIVKPNYVFETSWEICNKVGGINTVVASKSISQQQKYRDNFMLVGPDLWRESDIDPIFDEDRSLFKAWRQKAAEDGLRIKIGRWKVHGQPIVILVDFSPFIAEKNEIFRSFWESYALDSISGSREYIEAAVFGYAAGKVIESFVNYNLTVRDKVVAHFHDWESSAGILYLKQHTPQVATVYTNHDTTVGEKIAINGMDLYRKLETYNGDAMARELHVTASHSLEKISATIADCFTSVSEITAAESKQFYDKPVDVVTPNGFDNSFIPEGEQLKIVRQDAKQKLTQVASAVLGKQIANDTIFIANSGRYEFKSKGIDVFIDSIAKLKLREDLNQQVVAFIFIPANNYGPHKDLVDTLYAEGTGTSDKILTHSLHDPEYDEILNHIKLRGIQNTPEDKVHLIYVPAFLDGSDGIFNKSYFDILAGIDLTVFPSYYEPWGYTPLESLAFHIPTITTNKAGIGMWINRELVSVNDGIEVFDREFDNTDELVNKIVNSIITHIKKSPYDKERAQENAFAISRIALWKNLVKFYDRAYSIALDKIPLRADLIKAVQTTYTKTQRVYKSNKVVWNKFTVNPQMPEALKGLEELAKNLWWSWNYEAEELFESIDSELWEKANKNPIVLLKSVSYTRLQELEADKAFYKEFSSIYKKFKEYMSEAEKSKTEKIAYFSMEYGLINNLKIYSGGLGILAGDYLKEASDANYSMVAVGFLYKFGYFTQKLSLNGSQMVEYEPQDFANIPITEVKYKNGTSIVIQLALPGRSVYAKVWRVDVGRIPLYLLDTNISKNNKEDREISHHLYGGNNEHRLKQEMVLGIGGIRALRELEIDQDVYHINEGHAAFIALERLRELIQEKNFTFAESLEIVRASTLFTTHTPVPAGHDSFSTDLMMVYMGHYPQRLHVTWEEFINLGKSVPGNLAEDFSMSYLAANLAQEINGVSKLHGDVSKGMFQKLWDGYYIDELHISYVTNGVHAPTWTAPAWRKLFGEEFGKKEEQKISTKEYWQKIYKVSDDKIWNIKQSQRKILIDLIKERLNENWTTRHEDPKYIASVKNSINDKTLTIGFARRFATYKRAYLLFKNLDRLSKIVNNPDKPVQFLFAGKAHPHDKGGQDLIKSITEISKRPEFIGKVIFLENYDIDLAKKLVQGVDIWLNTPTRPLEASGTSGMKATMNGAMNFSVLDGWWVEGYRPDGGWALPLERTYENQAFQDELDAETIYGILEQEIVPTFYKRDEKNLPYKWIDFIKSTIANIAPEFTTKRMLDDYHDRFYQKLSARTIKMRENDYEMAKRLARWKKKVTLGWDSLEVVSIDFPVPPKDGFTLGSKYTGSVVLDLKELSEINVGIELILADIGAGGNVTILERKELDIVKKENTKVFYKVEFNFNYTGTLNYGLRAYPKNEELPHRQDFSYLKWI